MISNLDTIRWWYDWPSYKLCTYDPNLATSSQPGGYSDSYIFRLAGYTRSEQRLIFGKVLANTADDINVVRERAQAKPPDEAGVIIGTFWMNGPGALF